MKGMFSVMKKFGLMLLTAISLAACSFTPEQLLFLPTRTPSPAPTEVLSPTPRPSSTPTAPTPTFTLTPTMIGVKTPTITDTPTSTQPPISQITPATRTPLIQLEGFTKINVSTDKFYISGCEPHSAVFTAYVGNLDVGWVFLFVRFKSAVTGSTSEWTNFQMQNISQGIYSYELLAQVMKGYGSFDDPWIQYQLAARDINNKEVGRTQVFDELISLVTTAVECTPTPTSTSTETATPTPTVYMTRTPSATPER
jgi:hypothetical protein